MKRVAFILLVVAQLLNFVGAAANAPESDNTKILAQNVGISNVPYQSEDPANVAHAFNIFSPGIRSSDQQWSSDVAFGSNHIGFNRFLIHKACTTSGSLHLNSYIRFLLYPNHFFW